MPISGCSDKCGFYVGSTRNVGSYVAVKIVSRSFLAKCKSVSAINILLRRFLDFSIFVRFELNNFAQSGSNGVQR